MRKKSTTCATVRSLVFRTVPCRLPQPKMHSSIADDVTPRHMLCEIDDTQIGHIVGGVVGLAFAGHDDAVSFLALP